MLLTPLRRLFNPSLGLYSTSAMGNNHGVPRCHQRVFVESRDRCCYSRPSPDGSRIVCGGRAAICAIPTPMGQQQWRGRLEQNFPELKVSGFTHCWTDNTGRTLDLVPKIGQDDGIWHAVGYSGSGNQMAPYLGHKAALQLLGEAEGETVFSRTEFSTRWWHRGTPWFLPFADVMYRLRDGWNNLRR